MVATPELTVVYCEDISELPQTDKAQLLKLQTEFDIEHQRLATNWPKSKNWASLEEAMSIDDTVVYLKELDAAVGMVTGHVTCDNEFYISTMFVLPTHRETGLAELMLTEVVANHSKRDVIAMSSSKTKKAGSVFARFGFSHSGVEYGWIDHRLPASRTFK